jgi:predicted neuraminidase
MVAQSKMSIKKFFFFFVIFFSFFITNAQKPKLLHSELIDTIPVTPSCHASTIIEVPNGLMVAWFGGEHESHPKVGIYMSIFLHGSWTKAVEIANGKYEDGKQYACYNPVLQRYPDGEIVLFYKIGNGPSTWWGMLTRSFDNGTHWSTPEKLPNGIYGPIKNKAYLTKEGILICPSSTEDKGWKVHMEYTADRGKTWTRSEALTDPAIAGVIQPALIVHGKNRYELLMRSQQDTIMTINSIDGGANWSTLTKTNLPNPNAGIDAVTLKNGKHLLVYNPTIKSGMDRGELILASSIDGDNWVPLITLEKEKGAEFSYPAIIQGTDGLIHITYTWKRLRIKYVCIKI